MSIRLRHFVRKQQFDPGILGALINPFFLARRGLRRAIASVSTSLTGPLLDVGCGSKPYRDLFRTDAYVGLEIDTPEARERRIADAFYDGNVFPFSDRQFSSVLCNQVLEHVFNPNEFLREIHRVMTPGGKLLLTVPFVWDEHEQPFDFARYSSFGLKHLLERNGFQILEHKKLLADISVLFQLLNAYLFKVTRPLPSSAKRMITATVMAPISILGLLLGACLPRNSDLFLDQLVVAERL